MEASQGDYYIHHPNREKAEAKATKAAVVLLLLVSVALILIVVIGGWETLSGARAPTIAWVIIYLVMAYFVARWSRGVLPVAAALAMLFGIVTAIAAPGWFARDKSGFDDPTLDPALLGLIAIIIVPVQLLLIAFAMRGFSQEWNVEVEVHRDQQHGAPPPDQYGGQQRYAAG
jgi:protein-S-isoprenylcysteine O-methyltransferase Ste14